ncbi:hypothetical protein ACFXGR_22440 [Streptomyces mirabilis]|uniref:hypothetical protein n=1 Tax=Streptomyces mirabilis TaxID=68239 RepID=UPI0036866D9D
MSETITFEGPTRALAGLEHAFRLGQSVKRPGIITAAHTATWHMAVMIEHLNGMRSDFAEELRRQALDAGPVRPDEEPT